MGGPSMKLLIAGIYHTDADGNPVVFDTASKYNDMIKLYKNNECITTFGNVVNEAQFVLEGGTWSPAPKSQKEKEQTDTDTLLLELTSGTVSSQAKARAYARQVHEGKLTYPTDIPEDIRSDVYDAYTNHYKYQPSLAITTTLAEPYEVDEIQMVLTDGGQFPSEGTVTVSDSEHSTVIEFSDHKNNDLGGCRCIDGDKGVVYAAGSTVKLN